jgi:hypothetical protein
LDFHHGRPGLPKWRGRDHWHYNEDDDHLVEGDEIPDASASCSTGSDLERWGQRAGWFAVGVGAGIIAVTLIEDVATGGLGILDDPVTLGLGVGLIRYGLGR